MFPRKFTAALLLIFPAIAQPPLPGLRIEPTGGGSIFYVRNAAAQPLTAYVIELVDYPGSRYALWQDDIADSILPGAEKRIPVASMLVGAVPDYVKVRAAIYADGTSSGSPEKIAQLLDRRRVVLKTTRELIARLAAAESKGTSKALGDALRRWADSMTTPHEVPTRNLIAETASRLQSGSLTDVLGRLRATERILAGSKPAL